MRDISVVSGSAEEVAVVGYSARLPGAASTEQAWAVLNEGRCTVGEISPDRWSLTRYFDPNRDIAGKCYSRVAGLVDNVFDFDAGYFSLSPREAEQMDPQQRLLLEVVAEAFDHAGIDTDRLDKKRTGVFVGASSSDHSTTCIQDPKLIDAGYMLGNTLSIISNRISYHYDLHGPSFTIDTACSSGIFALDQARRAIASGEIDTAVVGSVNVLLSPMSFVGFSKASMLSETGICQAFGENADGYVRSEGAVVFILRNASLARLELDRIRSMVVASGTNSDGRTPGIAMPSSERQHDLLEDIKSRFNIDPERLAFIEAHGTGTAVGDPEEARAIGQAFGMARSKPLPIGSAKTNFGHLEPAAGLVGLLKAQLALEKKQIPASLHSTHLNPNIAFDELGLEVVQKNTEIPDASEPWLAAVNSFGFGGANAHAVLQQADEQNLTKGAMPRALMITAASDESLTALAETWREKAEVADSDLAQSILAANRRLTRHRRRLCVPASSPEFL
ncbi:MAG: beta-ketoacyl synthase N-terminal-like domain-containing protein, partial [Pseudomonadota bacterium]